MVAGTPTVLAIRPNRMWSEPPAEPPATGTLVGSAFSAATKSGAVLNGEAAGTTSASNSPVRRAIGVTSRQIVGRLVGDDGADHDHAGDHQRIALAVPLVDELRQADRAAGAADVGDLRAGDQLLAAQHLLHGARRLVPAAAGRRRHEQSGSAARPAPKAPRGARPKLASRRRPRCSSRIYVCSASRFPPNRDTSSGAFCQNEPESGALG